MKSNLDPKRILLCLCVLATFLALAASALAWDETGHVIVTRLAWEKLPPGMPDWLRTPEVRARLEYLCNEPDRWRGQKDHVLDHCNDPDHYIDEELLTPFGLTLQTLPQFRREFTDILATQRALDPHKFDPYDRAKDDEYVRLSPGMLPWTIAELQAKIASSWTTLKTYEQYRDCVTDDMIRNARENVVFHMGLISHFVGDGAQPLHLTKHHHGWAGENPKGYTTDRKFHAYIDGGVIELHNITPESIAARAWPARPLSKSNQWRDINGYLFESFELVEPLYALDKSGELRNTPGKQFIENRLLSGGSMLAGVWSAAYNAAKIDEFRAKRLQEKCEEMTAAAIRAAASRPAASQPAASNDGTPPAAR